VEVFCFRFSTTVKSPLICSAIATVPKFTSPYRMTIRCMISTTAHDTMKVTTESSSSKSLTPQRKHRKLLKSGEGEVWSEDVEQVFVEGHYSILKN
jgi:hypothetical protein